MFRSQSKPLQCALWSNREPRILQATIEAEAITPEEGGLADVKTKNPDALALSRKGALAQPSMSALSQQKLSRSIWSANPLPAMEEDQTVPESVPDWWYIFAEYDRFLLPGRIVDAEEIANELDHQSINGSLPSIDNEPQPDDQRNEGNLPDILLFDEDDRLSLATSVTSDFTWKTYSSTAAEWIMILSGGGSPFVQEAQVPDDLFFEPRTNIARFAKVFPFKPSLMKKWRDGIRLWPSKDCIRSFRKREDPKLHEDIVQVLLNKKIIEPMAKTRYVASMFVIRKGEDSFRPIFNYSAVTPH